MAVWKRKLVRKDKPWGHEDRSSQSFGSTSKIIHLKEGHRTSLKKMKTKNMTIICLVGLVRVTCPEEKEFTDEGFFMLSPGDQILIEHGSPFRLEALKDSVLLEITDSTKGEFLQGIEMLEDDYGRKGIHPGIVNFTTK